jgi:hypothetical protein
MHVGFRSWRVTGITWLALAGVDVTKMQRRAGHDEISTTIGHAKAAEDVTGSIGETFPPLSSCLLPPDAIDTAKARDCAARAVAASRQLDRGRACVYVDTCHARGLLGSPAAALAGERGDGRVTRGCGSRSLVYGAKRSTPKTDERWLPVRTHPEASPAGPAGW